MFESVLIRRLNHESITNPIDLGFLAESMLFYGNTKIIADHVIMEFLLRSFGAELLMEYLNEGFLEVIYMNQMVGIMSNDELKDNLYQTALCTLPDDELPEFCQRTIEKITGRRGYARRKSAQLSQLIQTDKFSEHIEKDINEDFFDQDYLKNSVQELIKILAPGYQMNERFKFKAYPLGDYFVIETDLDFVAVNSVYHKYIPPSHSTIDAPFLMSHLANTRTDLFLSAKYMAELATDDKYVKIAQLKLNQIIQKTSSRDNIDLFQEFVFDENKNIRATLNANPHLMKDFLSILQKSTKFKAWLKNKENDKSLIKEYYKDVTSATWIDKLPAKSTRWIFFTGAGLLIDTFATGGIGTAIGLAVSVGDNFLLDKLIQKWKPNQFVEDRLSKFVNTQR